MVDVHLSTPCRPTEVEDRVAQALCNLVPDADCTIQDDRMVGNGHDVTALRRRVWELRIIDTVRSALLGGLDGDTVRCTFSKQAAFGGQVRLPAGSAALGDIQAEFTVTEEDPWDAEGFVWWLCPETEDGEIVGPTD